MINNTVQTKTHLVTAFLAKVCSKCIPTSRAACVRVGLFSILCIVWLVLLSATKREQLPRSWSQWWSLVLLLLLSLSLQVRRWQLFDATVYASLPPPPSHHIRCAFHFRICLWAVSQLLKYGNIIMLKCWLWALCNGREVTPFTLPVVCQRPQFCGALLFVVISSSEWP